MRTRVSGLTIVYKSGLWTWQILRRDRVLAESTTRLTTAKGCWKNLVLAADLLLIRDHTPLTFVVNGFRIETELHVYGPRGTTWTLATVQKRSEA